MQKFGAAGLAFLLPGEYGQPVLTCFACADGTGYSVIREERVQREPASLAMSS